MSDNIYVPRSSGKEIIFQKGGSLMTVNFHAESLIEFVKANANEKGYVTFKVNRRREPDERGNTHYLTLDTWKPKGQAPAAGPSRQGADPRAAAPQGQSEAQRLLAERRAKNPAPPPEEHPEDDVPF